MPTESISGKQLGLQQRMRQAGQRLTPQRMMVLAVLSEHEEHLSAEQVFTLVQRKHPYVSTSTVYRTLDRLVDLGLVTKTDLGAGVHEYSLLTQEVHHHMICLQCQSLTAFDDLLLTSLREGLRQQHGFIPRLDHLAVFGICALCYQQMPCDQS